MYVLYLLIGETGGLGRFLVQPRNHQNTQSSTMLQYFKYVSAIAITS